MDYNKLLNGNTAFVTTATRGIGKDIALLFARHGTTVAFAGRNQQEVEKFEAELRELAPSSKGYLCDLSQKEQTESVCDQILSDFGGVDILVNVVGVNKQGYAHHIKDEDLERLLETNYKSGIRTARKFLPGMMERKFGNIINISSIHGTQTMPGFALYAGTKGAMDASARAMALAYAPYGIRVNNLAPGLIMSDVMKDEVLSYPEGHERDNFMQLLENMQPLPIGEMQDVSNAALFLASSMSAYITGQTILVDGGATAQAH